MSCIITVKGDGRGRNGKPKYDRTGPLEQFMVDNVYFYPIVFRHVKSCTQHDPNEILRHYITRRTARSQNMVTGTLVELALKYARNFKIDPNLITEYKWRVGIGSIEYRRHLSLLDYAKAVKLQGLSGRFYNLNDTRNPDHEKMVVIHSIVQRFDFNDILNMKDDTELAELIKVAEVMIS